MMTIVYLITQRDVGMGRESKQKLPLCLHSHVHALQGDSKVCSMSRHPDLDCPLGAGDKQLRNMLPDAFTLHCMHCIRVPTSVIARMRLICACGVVFVYMH